MTGSGPETGRAPSFSLPPSGRPALLTTAALTSVLLIALGQGSIASSDDALYAQMAREMAEAGRWLTATWLGVDVFEKPPLLLWLLRLTGPLFGWSEFGLRLPGVLGAAVALYYVCRLTSAETDEPWAGLVAGLLAVATVTFTFNARRPMTDPLLCASVMASLWYTVQIVRLPGGDAPVQAAMSSVVRKRRRWAISLGVAGGLGLLAKWVALGPAALVCALVLCWHRRWWSLGVAAAVAVLVAGPWFVAMTLAHGEVFWEVFLGYHVVARAGESLVGQAPWTVYLETLWELDGVLGVVLLLSVPAVVLVRRNVVTVSVATLAVVTLVTIHLASTRLYHYVMPVIPLAAVCLAIAASRRRLILIGCGVLGLVGLLAGPLSPTLLSPDYSPSSKAIGWALRAVPEETVIGLWEDYDPALTWYVGRPVKIWTQSEEMAAIQGSIDMMRRAEAVIMATPERLKQLEADAGSVIFVARRERAAGLLLWTRTVRGRVSVDDTLSETHLIVQVEPAS